MTIFLYGQDAYRLKQGSEQVLVGYGKKYPGSLNLFSFDLSDKEQRVRFEDALKTVSFFEEAKLVAVRSAFVSKEISEWTEKIVSDRNIYTDKHIVMMLTEQFSGNDLEKINKKFFRNLFSKSSTVRNFEYLNGLKLINWARSEFASRDCSIDVTSIKALTELTGNESWRIANEIEKLANYRCTKCTKGAFAQGVITIQDIKTMVSSRSDLNIFDFVDAVVSKNRPKAYEFLYKELKSGRDPHYILTMIVFGFRNMLLIKDLIDREIAPGLIAKKSGLHPFVVKKTSVNLSRFNLNELKASYGKLLEMDILAKNGVLNLGDTLFNFVMT